MFFRMTGLCLLCLLLFTTVSFAASRQAVHELNYFQTSQTKVDGRDALHIEIGMNHSGLDYTVTTNPLRAKQLVIDLQNTEIGRLNENITLDGHLGRYMTLRELESRHIQVVLALAADVQEQNYKVYTMEAERKTGKPYRLAIDIMTPQPAQAVSTGDARVQGVAGKNIVLDPGHGGSDSGAIGPGGVQEKDVTLAVAQKVRAILQNSGARIAMTRDTDVDVYGPNASDRQELQARVNVGAYTPGMQVFLSIHCNSFSSPSANGSQTFYYPKSDQDAQLAQDIQDELVAAGGLRDRGISEANFYVVKHSDVPAALVELAFISNYNEEGLLNSPEFQDKIALAIAKGLGRFFQDTGI